MNAQLLICGSSAAVPTRDNSPTAQVLTVGSTPFLIDAGEGVQDQLRIHRVRFQRIPAIFISHLHGDHVLGLPGLIGTMNLLGRTSPLSVFGPSGIRELLDTVHRLTSTYLKFDLNITEIKSGPSTSAIWTSPGLTVEAFEVKHRITTFGFRFTGQAPRRKLKPDAIQRHQLGVAEMKKLVQGINVQREDGTTIAVDACCLPAMHPWIYVYAADSRPCEATVAHAARANVLYHEATFLSDKKELAAKTYHSTAEDAGRIAQAAGVEHLVLGHFSNRYRSLDLHLAQAQQQFNGKISLAHRGKVFSIAG